MPTFNALCRRLTFCASCMLVSGALGAQNPVDSVARTAPLSFPARHPRATVATELLASTATIGLFDKSLAQETQKFRDGSGAGLQRASRFASSVGGYLPLAVGGAMALTGWATHHDFTRNLGTDVIKAVVASGLVTTAIKGTVGRARPRAVIDDPDKFSVGRGFSNNDLASFPSGHVSAAFAGAMVLASELSKDHPAHSKWIRVGIFGAATAIGYSRMYENAHWASDVYAGAAIGTLSGMWIVRQRNAKK